jgi:hypothetical protein
MAVAGVEATLTGADQWTDPFSANVKTLFDLIVKDTGGSNVVSVQQRYKTSASGEPETWSDWYDTGDQVTVDSVSVGEIGSQSQIRAGIATGDYVSGSVFVRIQKGLN